MARERFEDCLHKLEKIVSKLEEGDLPLEESLKYFEEGIRLSRFCNQKLEEAEKRVEILIKDKDGEERIEPFAPSTGSGRAPSTGSGRAPSTTSGQASSIQPGRDSGQAPSTGSGQALSTGSGQGPLQTDRNSDSMPLRSSGRSKPIDSEPSLFGHSEVGGTRLLEEEE